jgi:RNA polymerase sigma factor (sigma-70 family)
LAGIEAKLVACQQRLSRLAHQILPAGEKAFAPDLVQEAFRAACLRAQLIESMTSEEAYVWLTVTIRNQAKNHYRAARRLKRCRDHDRRLCDDVAVAVLVDDWPGPDDWAEKTELRERIDRALASLSSQEQRTTVILHYFLGWSKAEIAEALLRGRTAVSKSLARGLQQLKKCGLISPEDLD